MPRPSGVALDPESLKRPREELVYLQAYDWVQFLETGRTKSPPKEVFITSKTDSSVQQFFVSWWSDLVTFELDGVAGEERIKCVSVSAHRISPGQWELEVNSLFNVEKSEFKCNVEPDITKTPGMGSTVLRAFKHIAAQANSALVLDDGAVLLKRTNKPHFLENRMLALALAMHRGYGFYEGKGFLPNGLVGKVMERYSGNELATAILNAAQALLIWTHTVTTTPLNDLVDKVRSFHTVVTEMQVQDDHPVKLLFSKSNMGKAADRLNDASSRLQKTVKMLRLHAPDLSSLSMRDVSRCTELHYLKAEQSEEGIEGYEAEDRKLEQLYQDIFLRFGDTPNVDSEREAGVSMNGRHTWVDHMDEVAREALAAVWDTISQDLCWLPFSVDGAKKGVVVNAGADGLPIASFEVLDANEFTVDVR